jgi:hypothetical protein
MALSAALLIPNVAWAEESLADLAQKDPNATLRIDSRTLGDD